MPPNTLETRLRAFGALADDDIPLISSLLMLGYLDRPEADMAVYTHHIDELHGALAREIADQPHEGTQNVLAWRLARLNAVIRGQYKYEPDHDFYDAPDMINLLSVIDRRKGIPVALGAIYMELALRQNWAIAGLNFPGHFLVKLEQGGQRLIFDPFHDGEEVQASDMRQLLKSILGERAELHHDYYNAVTRRDVILRFYNNRKTRFITLSDYASALTTLEHQMWIAPREARLYFEAGVMSTKLGHIRDALSYLNEFVQLSQDVKTISEARDMIRSLQRLLQ